MQTDNITIRKAREDDDLEKIASLLYKTDEYIYPYWFENIENCKKELTPLILEKGFFFSIDNIYVAVDETIPEIIGITCIVDKMTNLDYDYSKLKKKNERYNFTIAHYVEKLIEEVNNSSFAYISNVCVEEKYRGKHIGNLMVNTILEIYKEKLFKEVVLDVIAANPNAIKLYQNLGFEQFSEIFEGFNNPNEPKPEVFSMKREL